MPETLEDRIARLQQTLDAGATSATVDGQTTAWDLATVRRQLLAAQAELAAQNGDPPSRPRVARIVLGHD